MVIREAEMKDAGCLDQLLTKLIQDEAQYDTNMNDQYVVKDNYASRIGASGHKVLLAEAEGNVVGYLYGFVYQIPEMYKRPVALLDALFVEEEFRGRGCAKQLFAEFQKFAKENGACRIELKVLSDNVKALTLYEKLSFQETKKYMSLRL